MLLVPLISSLFLSDINDSCPAQHLEQTRTLQVANLSSFPGHGHDFFGTPWLYSRLTHQKLGHKVFSAVRGVIWESHFIGSCSKYPQRA